MCVTLLTAGSCNDVNTEPTQPLLNAACASSCVCVCVFAVSRNKTHFSLCGSEETRPRCDFCVIIHHVSRWLLNQAGWQLPRDHVTAFWRFSNRKLGRIKPDDLKSNKQPAKEDMVPVVARLRWTSSHYSCHPNDREHSSVLTVVSASSSHFTSNIHIHIPPFPSQHDHLVM